MDNTEPVYGNQNFKEVVIFDKKLHIWKIQFILNKKTILKTKT
jgi:hypothetical protein